MKKNTREREPGKPDWGLSCEPGPKMALRGHLGLPYRMSVSAEINTPNNNGCGWHFTIHTPSCAPQTAQALVAPGSVISCGKNFYPALPPSSSSDPKALDSPKSTALEGPPLTHSHLTALLPLLRGLVGPASLPVRSSAFKRASPGLPLLLRASWPAGHNAF